MQILNKWIDEKLQLIKIPVSNSFDGIYVIIYIIQYWGAGEHSFSIDSCITEKFHCMMGKYFITSTQIVAYHSIGLKLTITTETSVFHEKAHVKSQVKLMFDRYK